MADEEDNLKDIFDRGFTLFTEIESDDKPSVSKKFQENVSQAINCLRKTTEKINDLALFSKNEELDDISTNNLRYLLLPALLGDLYLKSCTSARIDVVKMSKIYFLDFLERCKTYGIISQDIELEQLPDKETGRKNLEHLACERQVKITRYKKQKEQEQKIKELKKVLENSEQLANDEELLRKYYMLLLENWTNRVMEQISSINNELEILEHMEKVKQQKIGGNEPDSKTDQKKKRKFDCLLVGEVASSEILPKPILITREFIQNQVFGAGYPSLPTMTQEEYFEKELREGKIVTEFRDKLNTGSDNEEQDKESSEDEAYLVKLKKDREWDDWKDDHRRGWGNRENMG